MDTQRATRIECPICDGTGRIEVLTRATQSLSVDACRACHRGTVEEATCSQCDTTFVFPEDDEAPLLRESDFGGLSYLCARCRP